MSGTVSTSGLSPRQAAIKRLFDAFGAGLGLLLTFWLIGLGWIIATIDTRASGHFLQERIGLNGRRFRVIKLRTMRVDAAINTSVTTAADERITRIGRMLRRTKIDELPQLINVLIGDMSFVGPRPDVPGFGDRLVGEDRIVLSVRPGITGPATLKYRREEESLAAQPDPERYNSEVLYPDKVRINRDYIIHYSFLTDLKIIWQTIINDNE